MGKKFLILGIILFLFLGVFIAGRLIVTSRSTGEGKLKITSNVSARVFLNNKDIGKTPLEKKISAGEYSLRLVPDSSTGLSSWQDNNIKIGRNVLTYVNRDLAESELTSSGEILWLEQIKIPRGELTVLSIPDGAKVFLNDESKGITPLTLTDLSDGDYNLRVSSPGFESRAIRIKITSGYKLSAFVSLPLSPGNMLLDTSEFDEQLATSSGSLEITPTERLKTNPILSPTRIQTTRPSPTIKPSPTILPRQSSLNIRKVQILDTPTGFLRVREEPSTASAEIGRAKPGDKFSVLDIKDVGTFTWYKIAFTETQDGWISGQYAKKTE